MPERRPPSDAERLRDLEQRIEAATRAAERLLAETRAHAPQDGVPPRGWQRRGADDGEALRGWIDPDDARLLFTALSELRERIPPELERRVVVALRELLLAVRALIDWCVERAEHRSAPPAEVQDIPIL